MRLTFCAACGTTEDLQHHHLVMRAEGGSNHETNLITLCYDCHLKLHKRQKNGTYNAGQRVRAGQQAAKIAGIKIGRPRSWLATCLIVKNGSTPGSADESIIMPQTLGSEAHVPTQARHLSTRGEPLVPK